MLHTYKLYGTRILIDTDSGAVHLLDALGFDMLRYLSFPIESNCLSTLRYDLARYESADVAKTFAMFEKMTGDGVFVSGEDTASKYFTDTFLSLDADITVEYSGSRPVFATEVIRAADGGAKTVGLSCKADAPVKVSDMDIVEAELERIAKEIAKRRLGKIPEEPFDFIPFKVNTVKDENGYIRIGDSSALGLFAKQPEDSDGMFKRKCIECGLMLATL